MLFCNPYRFCPNMYNKISFPIPQMTRGVINPPITMANMGLVLKLVVTIFPVTGNSYKFYVCCIEQNYTLGFRLAGNNWVPHVEFYNNIAQIRY